MSRPIRALDMDEYMWAQGIRRREIEPASPRTFEQRRQDIADQIEDAEHHLRRFNLRTRISAAVGAVGLGGVLGGLALGGLAASFNLGVAPLVAAAIVAGVLLVVGGVAGMALAHDATPDDDHPADKLRKLHRRQRDLYLAEDPS